MFNYIIIEGDNTLKDKYEKIIKKFFYPKEEGYNIHAFKEYNNYIQNKINDIDINKIFIINEKQINNYNGYQIARQIRKNKDITSPMIILTNNNTISDTEKLKYALITDIVLLDNNLIPNMLNTLEYIYKLYDYKNVFSFSYFDIVHRIPYDEIYYFKKCYKDNFTTIYTKSGTYKYYGTIKSIIEKLNKDPRFMKVHKSCVVNTDKIKFYDSKNDNIVFNNDTKTTYIADIHKRELINKLKKDIESA